MNQQRQKIRVQIKPEIFRWVRERAGSSPADLERRFPGYQLWEKGEKQPTLKQLEQLADACYTPIGYFFLDSPPDEQLPIPDFRTRRGNVEQPSANLLDTIFLCQQRQAWYRDYLAMQGGKPLSFVGSVTLQQDPAEVASAIRRLLHNSKAADGYTRTPMGEAPPSDRQACLPDRQAYLPDRQASNWTEALRMFIKEVEDAGILVMTSGIVGNNPHRKLDPREFQGFTLIDDLAPVIFINSADTKAAQIFTLAHELAHVWLGKGGVSDADLKTFPDSDIERWCNQVAAELLVPLDELHSAYQPGEDLPIALNYLASYFKVSTLVILRRMYEAALIDQHTFRQEYENQWKYMHQQPQNEGGGNFYHTLRMRVGNTFAKAVVISALEGQTLFRDAYQLLGIQKAKVFQEFARTLKVL